MGTHDQRFGFFSIRMVEMKTKRDSIQNSSRELVFTGRRDTSFTIVERVDIS